MTKYSRVRKKGKHLLILFSSLLHLAIFVHFTDFRATNLSNFISTTFQPNGKLLCVIRITIFIFSMITWEIALLKDNYNFFRLSKSKNREEGQKWIMLQHFHREKISQLQQQQVNQREAIVILETEIKMEENGKNWSNSQFNLYNLHSSCKYETSTS